MILIYSWTSQSVSHLNSAECLNEEKKGYKRRKQKLGQRFLAVEEEICHLILLEVWNMEQKLAQYSRTGDWLYVHSYSQCIVHMKIL